MRERDMSGDPRAAVSHRNLRLTPSIYMCVLGFWRERG
jgi:hypothetical protein